MTLYIQPDRSQWWSVDTVNLRMILSLQCLRKGAMVWYSEQFGYFGRDQ
jgi:hypothetical protein